MHQNHTLIENRLRRVLTERINEAVYAPVAGLTLQAWHVVAGRGEPVQPAVALPGRDPEAAAEAGVAYQPFAVGDRWGPAWGTTWFHLTGTVPPEAAGQAVELVVDLGWQDFAPGFQSEGLVYRPDGTVVKAINPLNKWIPVAENAAGGEAIDLYVEAAANPLLLDRYPFMPTQQGDKETSSPSPIYSVARADINIFHTEVWELVQDLEVLGQLQAELPLSEPRRWNILLALEHALDAVDLTDIPGSAAAARAELAAELARPANSSAHQVSAIGHAHIDSAWLWPLRETVRKVARTSSNVVNLLDTHPDLQFAMSSAQQYEWIKDYRPEVFARVKDAVAAGRFVPVGGMWVESDTNMVGSEAMARQFTYGQRFFRENFGVQCQEVWLPDSFGYSAALPQIVKLAGAKWFLTQKISWNQVNKFPHHTFNWEGIDGTRMFTHFPPVDTYNSELSGKELAHAVSNFRDKGASNHSLVPFGWGDGGGGPTREMVARARRTRDLEGSPQVTIRTPREFFTAAEAEYPDAPVWKGELYLELHRGTYTSQALTKQGNRRNEHLLREAELWSATAAARGLLEYPYDELDRIWKEVLLLQFHDILPGTSIAWVHREAAERHAQITADLNAVIDAAQAALAAPVESETRASLPTGTSVLFNASPFARHGVPPLSAGVPHPTTAEVRIERNGGAGGKETVVHNGMLVVTFGADGVISSILDVAADREVVPAGQGANLLQLHADFPNMWDAWDIDEFYKNTVTELRQLDSLDAVVEDGAAVVTVRRSFGSSSITQRIRIAPDSARIEVANSAEWHEQEKLLKAAFPVDVHTDQASFETQYGHIRRATHENTSWDNARFEVCAHRWAQVEERGYGAAVVNDSTYGHDVARHPHPDGGSYTTVRLSLLRGPRFPDPQTDQGHHEMRYTFVVGASVQDAVEAGYDLNLPPRSLPGTPVAPLVSVSEGVLVEAVKLADDRSGDVVVRLYEPYGSRAKATLGAGFALAAVVESNLLEQEYDGGALTSWDEGSVALSLRPFQIVTLRLTAKA
jgi:alpha-mannosidase